MFMRMKNLLVGALSAMLLFLCLPVRTNADTAVLQKTCAEVIQAETGSAADALSEATVLYSGTCGENVTWTLTKDGTLTISGTGAMKNYGYEGGQPWMAYANQITSVVVENGVTAHRTGENAETKQTPISRARPGHRSMKHSPYFTWI